MTDQHTGLAMQGGGKRLRGEPDGCRVWVGDIGPWYNEHGGDRAFERTLTEARRCNYLSYFYCEFYINCTGIMCVLPLLIDERRIYSARELATFSEKASQIGRWGSGPKPPSSLSSSAAASLQPSMRRVLQVHRLREPRESGDGPGENRAANTLHRRFDQRHPQ